MSASYNIALHNMPSLTRLPSELVDAIIEILAAEDPPSKRYLHEEPSLALLFSSHQPLKSLTQTCRLMHQSAFPYLFSSVKSTVESIPSLVAFAREMCLEGKVESLVLYSDEASGKALMPDDPTVADGPASGGQESDDTFMWLQIQVVMKELNPSCLTVMLPPAAFHEILPYRPGLDKKWFMIPHQILHLEQRPNSSLPRSTKMPALDQKIFGLREWSHMTLNEGSSVRAYSTYQYYHKYAPSLLDLGNAEETKTGEPFKSSTPFSHLTSLDMIGIFPFNIVSKFESFAPHLPNLQHLRTQFTPSSGDLVVESPSALGTTQSPDLWAEVWCEAGEAYGYLEYLVCEYNVSIPNLKEITILDYANPVARERLWGVLSGLADVGWHDHGNGHWDRDS